MVLRCVVNTCSTTFGSRGRRCKPEGVKLHRFPRAPGRLCAWIDNIRTVNGETWAPANTENTRICSLHFAPSAYELERQDGLMKLKWNAVPTIFIYSKSGETPTPAKSAVTTDHLYSVARDEATRQEKKNSRRKVLESIMNSQVPDHLYASPYQEPPLCKIQSIQTLECEDSSPEDDMVTFPTLQTISTEDCEIIDLDEDTSDSIEEIPIQKETNRAQEISQNQVKTCLVNGILHVEMPDGHLAQLLSGVPVSEKWQTKNVFTDSEVDKLQIKQLSDENRKLQDELNRVRAFAEKLLRQNERLRQQNRVTARAYRDLKKTGDRSNGNLRKWFDEDQNHIRPISTSTAQNLNQETAQEAVRARCDTKESSQRLPYSSVRELQDKVVTLKEGSEKKSGDLLELLAPDVPEENPQENSIPDGSLVINKDVTI